MVVNITVGELWKEYEVLRGQKGFLQHMLFCKKLRESDQPEFLDFHYWLLSDRSVNKELYQQLRRAFEKRGPAAEKYLQERITSEKDRSLQGDILQILGGMKYYGGKDLGRTVELARDFLASDDDCLRCRAIWVLGWLGTQADIDHFLSDRLLHDANCENRGWAASAMMQIYFSEPATAERSLGYLRQAIRTEDDYFALELILVSIQEITGKKLGLKPGSRTRASKEAVDKALNKALGL